MAIQINGSGTVTGLSVGGLPDGSIVTADLASSVQLGLFSSYALLCDERTNDTNGGTATAGSWFKRELNTEIADPDGIVSLSSDQFTLQAGNYLIKWQCVNYITNRSQTRIYDTTNSAVVGLGLVVYAHTGSSITPASNGVCRVTPSGATVYELQNRVQATKATYGRGVAGEFDDSAERYALVEIYKEAS